MVRYNTTNLIGATTRSIPRAVFFDTHTQIKNNQPGTTFVTGAPGSGKTFFCQNVAAMSAIQGKNTVVIDWKGDFVNLELLKHELGDVRIWAIGSDSEPGMLDPFFMSADKSKQLRLAVELISILVGGVNDDERAILRPIIKDVQDDDQKYAPSLERVTQALRSSRDYPAARGLGNKLALMRESDLAKVCFAPGHATPDIVDLDHGGVTVITLKGIQLPREDASTDDAQTQMSLGIFYLLTSYIEDILEQETLRPKTLIVDEAWAMLMNAQGKNLVKRISLLGRSHKFALILATQNYTHAEGIDIDNTIATRFAFRAASQESLNVQQGLGLDGVENIPNLLSDGIMIGECIMRDWRGRYATVKIKPGEPGWESIFNTNPFEQ